MFKRILIANRGEIAVRIIRACYEMGIETIAVYSTLDKDSLHVKLADKSVCIGDTSIEDSYLNMYSIITAAKLYKADAIHPGYGFLSENADFAKLCSRVNIKFIGPHYNVIEMMGDKAVAIKTAVELGIPTIKGSDGIVKDVNEGKKIADNIGYPILIKAAKGGGGKGIRLVESYKDFERFFKTCSKESLKAFGSEELYVEKYVKSPRHIEVQVLADEYKNVVILGDRDCTIQRRNQKFIEEAPAVVLEDETRMKLWDYSKLIAKGCNYTNAGTVEFLLEENKNVYFMEMNTRLQVEHPVTEFITGIDIVKEQIRIAMGLPLSVSEEELIIRGHSIECRINSEVFSNNFMVSSGKITDINFPGGNGVRIDTGIYRGAEISTNYDSNIAKLIVYGRDRDECIRKMRRALVEFVIEGVDTNIEFLLAVLNNEKVIANNYSTSIIDELIENKELNILKGDVV